MDPSKDIKKKYVEKTADSVGKVVRPPKESDIPGFYTLENTDDVTQDQLAQIIKKQVIGITITRRKFNSLLPLTALHELRWLEIYECPITQVNLAELAQISKLQTMVLRANQIQKAKMFGAFRNSPSLTSLAIGDNPICQKQQEMNKLSDMLSLKLFFRNLDLPSILVMEIKKENLATEFQNEKVMKMSEKLKKQESIRKTMPNLVKVLTEMKKTSPNLETLVYDFLSYAKNSVSDLKLASQHYGRIPWILLQQWPGSNFIQLYKISLKDAQSIFGLSPEDIVNHINMDHVVHHLLDDYYIARLKYLFREAKQKFQAKSVDELCRFLFVASTKFFLRNQYTYFKFSPLILNEVDYIPQAVDLLLKSKEHIVGLELAATQPNKEQYEAAEEPIAKKMRQILRKLKVLKLNSMFLKALSPQTGSFEQLNLCFINKTLRLFDVDQITYDLSKTDRVKLFSDLILDELQIKQYLQFYYLQVEGEPRYEEMFNSAVVRLLDVTKVYGWIDELEAIQQEILTLDGEGKYQRVVYYFKKLVGRPDIGLDLLKDMIDGFDFDMFVRLLDCESRELTLKSLMNQFGSDFSFIIGNILTGKQPNQIDMIRMRCAKVPLSPTSVEKREKFYYLTNSIMSKFKNQMKSSPIFECLEGERKDFPILCNLIRINDDEPYTLKLLEIQNEQKLQKEQKKELLRQLKNLIGMDDTHIWLQNRKDSEFVTLIKEMRYSNLYDDNLYLVRLLEFSYQLYLFSQNEETEKLLHKNDIDVEQLKKCQKVEDFLYDVDNKRCLSDCLNILLKDELYFVLFDYEQNSLTFSLQRYKELRKHDIIKDFIGEDVMDLLDLILKNSVSEFIEIKIDMPNKSDAYNHDYMVRHVLTPGKNDKAILRGLENAYLNGIIKVCLKKDLTNLADFQYKIQDVMRNKVAGTGEKLRLAEISQYVKHRLFKDSELSRKLIRYFKSQDKTEDKVKQVNEEYKRFMNMVNDYSRNDRELLNLFTSIIEGQQTDVFVSFLNKLPLVLQIKEHDKIYQNIRWEFFQFYNEMNHRQKWEASRISYLQEAMDKNNRLFLKYLRKPEQCGGQAEQIKKIFSKFQNIIYKFELEAIIDGVSQKLGITYPKNFCFKMIANKLHYFMAALNAKDPSVFPWLPDYNYYFCQAIRNRVGQRGFTLIQQYLMNQDVRLESVTQTIVYQMEYYQAETTINRVRTQRVYNPAKYFQAFLDSIDALAKINSANSFIQRDLVKVKYVQLPWTFMNLQENLKEPYWMDMLQQIDSKFGLYLQLIHYLNSRETKQLRPLILLSKVFVLMHSEISCNDLILRIREILRIKDPLVECVLNLERYKEIKDLPQQLDNLIKQLRANQMKFDNDQLIAMLRVFALRGQYLNKIEKINNRLRNILSDYDEVSIDFEDYLRKSSMPKNSNELQQSLLKILDILFNFKCSFFRIITNKTYIDLLNINLKDSFNKYKDVDLKLSQVETVNYDSVKMYFGSLLKTYVKQVKPNLTYLSPNYQQAELYQIAVLTSVRDQEKLEYLADGNPKMKQIFDRKKEGMREHRNYLAHYNSCLKLERLGKDGKIFTVDKSLRQEMLIKYDRIIREMTDAWL